MSANRKTEDLINQYVNAPLKEHIRQAEAAFPPYELVGHQIVAEGDIVAVRGTFYGVHKGEIRRHRTHWKESSGDLMLFYRISGGHESGSGSTDELATEESLPIVQARPRRDRRNVYPH